MRSSVIIIGAGISGLYAATLLEKAGVDYVILEARDRTGGRVLSGEVAGLHVDMGAAWFWPQIQPEFAQLIGQLGLTVIPQGRPGDMLYERHPSSPAQRYPAYETAPPSFRLKGGMQALTAALRYQVPANRIKLNQQVKSIIRTEEGMQVLAQTGAGEETLFTCEHIFLALPPALAANIAFSPALPEALLSNWRTTPTWMAPHAKYVAVYNTDFLQAQRLSGDASSQAGPMVEIHDVSEPDSGKTVLFGFIGVPAKSRWTVSEEMLIQLCREQLARLFGPDAAAPEAEFLKDWAADPFTATEYDLLQEAGHTLPESVPDRGEWTGKITGIASEWSPQFSGYLAGAIDSASMGIQGWLRQP
ncbi:FAD-dependent oxidoreductase [Leclercia pneumoniae]|uniref:flavin monoamine oxidase family protein n=1 Tax=Leclercia pneumoniae TaxID=2815358 RepID=UPI0021E59DC4|nr:FAD-dependent oxidoreductase [Leclercia pneumoniae]MCV2510937.1 FAD-dependent oxidoreductase [Leclercia pneumoniae]WNN82280.1 FAD-dependent oxidoreductase [Leclercia pneumoniae]